MNIANRVRAITALLPIFLRGCSKRIGQRGASLLEYSLVVGLIALLAVISVVSTGETVRKIYCQVTETLQREIKGDTGPFECLGSSDLAGLPGAAGPRVIIPDTYAPVDPNLVMIFAGNTAGFFLDATGTGGLIEWGDGQTTPILPGDRSYSHTYASAQEWTVNITGVIRGMRNVSTNVAEVVSFGTVGLQHLSNAFTGATNLRFVAALPDTVTNIGNIFMGATSVPEQVAAWNVSNVVSMDSAFMNTPNFNLDIAYWDVSNATGIQGMFYNSASFNADISAWDTSNATSMRDMFRLAVSFNADISAWDTSNVTSMNRMFLGAVSFNQPIGGWDVTGASAQGSSAWDVFDRMFSNATSFNQPLDGWDMSWVRNSTQSGGSLFSSQNLTSMFSGASAFAQDLSGWCLPLHPTIPSNFSSGSPMVSQPLWGQSC